MRHLDTVMERAGYLEGLQKIFEEKFETRGQDLKKKRASLEIRMVELENEINHAFKLHMDLGQSVGVDLIKEKLSKLSETKSNIKRQVDEIDLLLDKTPDASTSRKAVEENLTLFHRGWRKATSFQKKSLLHLVFDTLVVAPEEIGAFYKVTDNRNLVDTDLLIEKTLESETEVVIPFFYSPTDGVQYPSQGAPSSKGYGGSRVRTIGADDRT